MKNIIFASLLLIFSSISIVAQNLTLQFLESGVISNSCTSVTDSSLNVQCYAIQYTPGGTGTLTSYTLGFIGSCQPEGSPYLAGDSHSCVMADNSTDFDACNSVEKFLIQLSGNTGTIAVTEGQPITVHQICFNIVPGDTIILEKDETSGHTFSIDPADGGDPFTDMPSFTTEVLVNEFSCELSTLCSIDFGLLANKVLFDVNLEGNLVDASSLENTFAPTQSFDVYDEVNQACSGPGGIDDISFEFQIINTIDINNNGLIDTLAGEFHHLKQGMDGIVGSIPFNIDEGSESSAGDIRGYSIEVKFAAHIGIIADQLTVHLEGVNSAGVVFESAALIFQDESRNDYGSLVHQGYFGGENDLMGNCDTTYAGINYDVMGTGVIVFQDTAIVEKSLPCDIDLGTDGSMNSPSINARIDAGLDSAAVVSGFKLIVFGEDVAAPNLLDDGSGLAPDDGIRGNAKTNTSDSIQSTIKGITITGCVFEPLILPLNWVEINARTVREDISLEWTTVNEVNTDNFEIEWSKNGRDFEVIGELESNNSLGIHRYNWLHELPSLTTNYYRVKQIDLDGRYSYSDIVSASINRPQTFSVYPNPASQNLYINSHSKEVDFDIQIFDVSGILVLDVVSKSNSIDISSLNAGLFHLIIKNGNDWYNTNFIKSKQQ